MYLIEPTFEASGKFRPVRLPMPRDKADALVRSICEPHGFTLEQIKGQSLIHALAHVRQSCYAAVKERMGWSLPQTGRYFGDRDHTTIIYGIRVHKERLAAGEQL